MGEEVYSPQLLVLFWAHEDSVNSDTLVSLYWVTLWAMKPLSVRQGSWGPQGSSHTGENLLQGNEEHKA